jgi:hypothetical protein
MYKNKEMEKRETDKAFALATIMLNVLILLVLGSAIWSVQTLTAESGSLGVFLSEVGRR